MLHSQYLLIFVASLSFVLSSPVTNLPQKTVAPKIFNRAPSSWVHPGVLNSKAQLDFVKAQVAKGAEPWSGAFSALLKDPIATSTRTPSATFATVTCGPTSTPDVGCTAEREDALAAYGNALAWYITSNTKYAKKAIQYLNAWSATLRQHADSNSKLQEGWSASSWSRAAEIIAHTNAGWSAADITTFKTFLRDVYLKNIIGGSNLNGNWELVMMEASIGIAVFLEDSDSYDKAMNIFLKRVPEYVYLQSDGSGPVLEAGATIASYWNGMQIGYFNANGIAQETCRDLAHTGLGLASIGHVAETARHQGNDLFRTDVGTRLRYGLDFHAQFLDPTNRQPVPSFLCSHKGHLNYTLGPVTEVGLNAMHFRLGYGMDHTLALTVAQRPAGRNLLFVGWETLTHANQPN